jgi:ferredoxin
MRKKKIKISIDYSKCISPEKCRICLNLCQPAIFNLTFIDKDYHNPKKWKIIPVFPQLCTICNFCINKCPEKAISIKI